MQPGDCRPTPGRRRARDRPRLVEREDNHDSCLSARGVRRSVFARRAARLRPVRQRREGGRRLQLRRGRRRGPRHQGFPFGRRPPDLRHRDPHRRQRLLRPGLCRGEGRRQHDRRQHPAARLGIAGGRSRPRDRDPEPDHPGPDHRRHHHDHAAGRRLQRHRQGRRGERHPGRHHQLVRRDASCTAAPSATPARTRRRRRSAARRWPTACSTAARPAARSCFRPRPRWATSRSTTA